MMLKENHQNLSCEFAEEIVSYLYNEMFAAEKLRFESHLANCSFCADEIAEFSSVRSEIINWKARDFDTLPTPIFEIPLENSVQPVFVADNSRPWYAAIRDYFSLSPIWLTASTAFAVLAICLGLVFVTISSLRNDKGEVVQEKSTNKPVSTPTTEVKKVESNNPTSGETSPNSNKSSAPSLETPQPNAPTPIKIGDRQPLKPKNSTVKKNVSPTVDYTKVAPKSNKSKSTSKSLTGDDEEDNSLRLSDLFDEIGDKLKK